jgi:ribosomal protein S1
MHCLYCLCYVNFPKIIQFFCAFCIFFCNFQVVPSGVKGHFLENCFGYLDESQIYSKINIEKLREGSKISAHVLFTEPVTKVTYLTLREFEVLPKLEHAVGKVLSARVVSHASKGLNVQLGKSAGFVTNKRLLNTLRANAQMDVTDAIRRSFPCW